MRKFLVPILLAATAVSPALAQRSQEDIADRSGGDRTLERRGGHGNEGRDWQRPARNTAPQAAPQAQQPKAAPPPVSQSRYGQRRWDGGERSNGGMTTTPVERRPGWNDRAQAPSVRQPPVPQPSPNRTWDRDGDGRPDVRQDRNRSWDGNRDRDQNWNRERPAEQQRWRGNNNWGNDQRRDNDRRWNNDRDDDRRGTWNRGWRDDRRYDWRQYRNQNRNYYRMPRYYDPYGYRYGYRRFSIGIFLDDLFFSSRYWISDPWEYRLPPASGPYRWVRYYDDVLLVDLRNGRVVDVIYDFFW